MIGDVRVQGSGQNFGLLVVVNKVSDFSEIRFKDKGLSSVVFKTQVQVFQLLDYDSLLQAESQRDRVRDTKLIQHTDFFLNQILINFPSRFVSTEIKRITVAHASTSVFLDKSTLGSRFPIFYD